MSWFNGNRSSKVARTRTAMPLARTHELVTEEFADEVLVYDQRTSEAHCLSVNAARVWRACDGSTPVMSLAGSLSLEADTVARAIEELEACGLLEAGSAPVGVTRREVSSRVMRIGAAAASAPLIYSILAPTPALATSEATCFAICDTGCGSCKKAGCCCTSPGGGSFKLCTADLATCISLGMNVPFPHCGETITSTSCAAGCM